MNTASRWWAALAGALVGAILGTGCRDGAVSTSADATPASDSSAERSRERERMVARQIEARGVLDPRVLAAMRAVPRHRFVPREFQDMAYADQPLAIGHGQTISQPYIVAFMTQALDLDGSEKVLEIGTGSGYQAAVLAEIVRDVYTIEIVAPLARQAAKVLAENGYGFVRTRAGDGYLGWPEEAPFDAIIVTAAPDHVPQPLIDQLAMNGRMILPVGEGSQDLVLIRRTEAGVQREEVLPVRFVPMTGIAEEKER